MLLVIENLVSGEKHHFPMNTATDVARFLKEHPELDHLRAVTHDIKDFAAEACQELGHHHIDAYTEESEHFEDNDPWTSHKYSRGGEDEMVEWARNYHEKTK